MTSKRKASAMGTAVDDEPVDPSDELAFYCLGGGNEVGRSCHILEYKGKTVMVSLKLEQGLEQGMDSQILTPLASVARCGHAPGKRRLLRTTFLR